MVGEKGQTIGGSESKSRQTTPIEKARITNTRCELVSGEDVSFLEGKLKTQIDGMGLSEKQEKASKDILQTVLWDWFNYITEHKTDHLKEKIRWYVDKGYMEEVIHGENK